MNDEDLLKKIAALRAAGATPDEIEAWVNEHDQPSFDDVQGGASVNLQKAKPTSNEIAEHLAEGSAPAASMDPRNARQLIAGMTQGATFGFADEVLPGAAGRWVKQQDEDLRREAPVAHAVARGGGGMMVPGVGSIKAIQAIKPTTMLGQVALGAGLGAANAGLSGAGDAEGGFAERLKGAADAAPGGALVGGAFGAVPGLVTGALRVRDAIKEAPQMVRPAIATGRSALRLLRGKPPSVGDVGTIVQALARRGVNIADDAPTSASEDIASMLGPRRLADPPPVAAAESPAVIEAVARQALRKMGVAEQDIPAALAKMEMPTKLDAMPVTKQRGATRARLRADEERLDLPRVTPEPPQGVQPPPDEGVSDLIIEQMRRQLQQGAGKYSPGNPYGKLGGPAADRWEAANRGRP